MCPSGATGVDYVIVFLGKESSGDGDGASDNGEKLGSEVLGDKFRVESGGIRGVFGGLVTVSNVGYEGMVRL